ncbi:hypoxia up-regulated protein 1-like isoform X1 [Saccostrea echinata]|uniref:hypoxia up-regulated protein 1-like isoform X1 n=1 Tax=Saccostrea echinata TaxID=191078 RepID=UPI002A803880|nr:hypoxia up-regulated protein 1-like isoform X1 [Saccostrea echinata]
MHCLQGGWLALLAIISLVLPTAYGASLAVMSIDLGSEFMKIGIVKPGVPMEIVLNDESARKTSTIVALRNGERLFGSAAENTAVKFPKMAYWYLTQIIGKRFEDPHVEMYRKRFPYYNIIKDEVRGTPLFKVDDETTYSPEELLAMVLEKAKSSAEAFADTPISDAVITVPSYFTQAERRAVREAAEMVGINVLQLISDNVAVALNYGVFRRKMFNSTTQYYMFYDAGATSTSATIIGYQMVKVKEGDRVETYPQLSVKGVGFDKSLGGLEMTLRLREHLAKLFNAQKKTKTDVFTNDRAMGKLFKEANRLKKVLSANTEHMAQVEGLLEDIDFKAKVTRDEFEEMNKDLFERVLKPIEDALKTSHVTLPEITDVILMGGGTRVPKMQDMLLKYIKRDVLGKSINTDEAAALGAVYHAAELGKGFKVKKFLIKDACHYPIVVEFEKQTAETTEDKPKVVKRTLFGRMNPYPQKKVMTFNKHVKDFSFNVTYGDLSFLSAEDLKSFPDHLIHTYHLKGVEEALKKHAEKAESKGVKAHFRMDEDGILHLDKVEFVFEKEGEAEESTWSKLGDTISGLFGGKDKKEEEKKPATDETAQEGDKSSDKSGEGKKEPDDQQPKADSGDKKIPADEEKKKDETTEKPAEEKKVDDNKTDKKDTEKADNTTKTENKTEEVKPKVLVIKEDIVAENVSFDIPPIPADKFKASKKRLTDLTAKDKEKKLLEKAKNDLEAFVYDMGDKIHDEDHQKCSTETEREELSKMLSDAGEWMYEQEEDAKKEVFQNKLKELKKAVKDLKHRVKELIERPKALEALNSMLNHSEYFLVSVKNLTLGEDPMFTEVEANTLEKLINESYQWLESMTKEQNLTPLTEKPKMLVEDIAIKYQALDREVKYLINKAKIYRPKAKPKTSKNTTSTNDTKTNDTKTESSTGDDKSAKSDKDEGPQLDVPETETKAPKRRPKSKRGEEKTEGEEEILQLDESDKQEKSQDTTDKTKDTDDTVTHDSSDL